MPWICNYILALEKSIPGSYFVCRCWHTYQNYLSNNINDSNIGSKLIEMLTVHKIILMHGEASNKTR